MTPIKLPNLPTPGDVLRHATLRPSSAIPPVSNAALIPKLADASKTIDILWENNKSVLNDAYKIGKSYHGIEPDASYIEFLSSFLTLFFSSLKEQIQRGTPNIEEQQGKMLLLSAIQASIKSNIDILKAFDFAIDKNLLIATLNGYSMTQVTGILKN